MKSTRRTFLETMLTASAAVALGPVAGRWNLRAAQTLVEDNILRFPPLLEGNELVAAKATMPLLTGKPCGVLTFNGLYPGPTIRRKRGEKLDVRLVNNLDEPLIVHWHGVLPPAMMDGHPHHAIAPGEVFEYSFTINQRGGTFFYHAHTHGATGNQVYRGLAGLFIIDDDDELALGLPTGEYDIPLLLQDRHFDDNGQLLYAPGTTGHMEGYIGDVGFVNGTPGARLNVTSTLYRFRLANGSNARIYRVVAGGRPFHVIATDGGLIEKPVEVQSLFLAPGERADVLVDLSHLSPAGIGSNIASEQWAGGVVEPQSQGSGLSLLTLICKTTGEQKPIPASLSSIEWLDPDTAITTRTFEFSMMGEDAMINGLLYDMERIDVRPRLGTTEIWEFYNKANIRHPIHVHGTHFQILSRKGNTNIPEYERGWKDTVLVAPFERVQVILRFDEPGLFLMHCHTLEHEDKGMMMNFLVEDTTDVAEPTADERPIVSPNPATDYVVVRCAASGRERTLKIVDSAGREMLSTAVPAHTTEHVLDIRMLAPGMYSCVFGAIAVPLVVVR